MLRSHETAAALRLVARNRHRIWGSNIRVMLENHLAQLRREAETDEERRDVRRLWDLMNEICAKHARRAR